MRFEKCPSEDGLPERWVLGDADAGVTATVVPAAGMNLVSLVVGGVDRLALPLPLESFMGTAKTGGVPLLHPWANRLRADCWSFDGVEVDLSGRDGLKRDANGLPMHGLLLRETEWVVSGDGVGDRDEDSAVEGVLHWTDDHPGFEAFPFPHEVAIRWTVRREGGAATASCRFRVDAGDRAVPIATGWHPYLRPAAGATTDSIAIEVPSARRAILDERGLPVLDAEGRPTLETAVDAGGPIGDRRFDDLFLVADAEAGWTAAVVAGGARIELEADAAWRWMQVFTPEGSDAVCIEPMLAPTSALVDGGVVRVEPGQRFEAGFTIRVVTEGADR